MASYCRWGFCGGGEGIGESRCRKWTEAYLLIEQAPALIDREEMDEVRTPLSNLQYLHRLVIFGAFFLILVLFIATQ